MSEARGRIHAACAALAAAGLEACILRDDPALLDELDEVDLLIPRADLGRAVQALEGEGWELLDTGLFHPHKRALLAWEGDGYRKLDLHGSVIEGPLVYMDAAWVMKSGRSLENGARIPSDEAWLLHVLLHTLLGKPSLAEKHEARVRALFERGLDRQQMLAQAKKSGLRAIAERLLDEPALLSEPCALAALRRRARRALMLRPLNALRTLRSVLTWTAGRAFGLRRGFLVAVIGPDGVGKTSFVTALCAELERLDAPARAVYMGPWEPTRLPTSRFLAWLGANPLDEIPGTGPGCPASTRITKRAKGLVKRYAWYASALVDLWARYLAHVLPRLLLRRVVVADRYAHDLEVGYYNELVSNSPRLRRALVRLAPHPRLTVLLDDEAAQIHARKPEYPLEVLSKALDAYRALPAHHAIEPLRAERPPAQLARELAQRHWRDFVAWRRDGIRRRARGSRSNTTPRAALRVEWIGDEPGLQRIAEAWDRAVRASQADEPFLLTDFLLSWWKHFGAGRSLRIAVVTRGGELAGGLPLYAERRARATWLRYPGAEDYAVANRTNLLAPRLAPEVLDALLSALSKRSDWDVLELPRLHASPEQLDLLRGGLRRHGLLLLHEQSFPGYLIDVPPSLEAFLAGRSKGFRTKLRRAERLARATGALDLAVARGGTAVRALFERFIGMSRDCHRARDGRSTFEDERLCAFFGDLLLRFDALGMLDAHELSLAGRPIAIGFGYSLKGNLNDVLTTFDASSAELMPGNLMTRAQLALAIERGAALFDLASGASPHKDRWATRTEEVHGLLIGRATLSRRVEHAARRMVRRFRQRGSRGLARTEQPRPRAPAA